MLVVARDGTRPIAALIAAVLAVMLLGACGSSDSSSSGSTSTSASSSSSTTADTTARSGRHDRSSQKSGGHDQSGGQPQPQKGSEGGSSGKSVKEVETPLKVSGGGSAQFRTKGGDNSVQEFGGESDESELREAAEAVHGFYVSRAAEEWSRACSYLSKSNIEQLEQLAHQAAQSKGADCTTVLKAFTQPLPASVEREITTVDAGSLRREGEQGFLIYYGAGHVKYAMPMRKEGGAWKVTALSGTTLG
jgi:flagellum-specific peptidoglycan hydrolase FlgJ